MAPRHWAALPPRPPTVASAPRVGQADQFVAALAGTRPLVHPPALFDRSKDAPAGLVRGMTTTRPLEVEWPVEPDRATSEFESAGVDVQPQVATPVPDGPPRRRLRVTAAPRPDAEPLTQFTDDPGPLIHATPPAPPVQVARSIASEPIGSIDAEVVEEQPPSPPGRLNLGQSRRFGLGLPTSRPADESFTPADLIHAPAPAPRESGPPGGDVAAPTRAGPALETPIEPAVAAEPITPIEPVELTHPTPSPPEIRNLRSSGADSGLSDASSEERTAPVLPRYRPAPSAPPEPLPAEPRALRLAPVPVQRRVEQVPHDVAGSFQATHGISVRDVPIHRGPDVSEEARSLGAVAYARGGDVFVPDEAGPLDRPETRGLLAHELTHVVQRRMLGGLPSDGSGGAEQLEAEAQDAERFFRGDAGAPEHRAVTQTLVHPPKAAVGLDADSYADEIADELVTRGIARREWDGTLAFGPSPEVIQAQVSEAVQRATGPAPSGPPPSASSGGGDGGGGGGMSWTSVGGFVRQAAIGLVAQDVGNLLGIGGDQHQTQQAQTQHDRRNLQEERDDRFTRLLQAENERRTAAGEQTLDHTRDADRIRQLREQADQETNFHDRSQRLTAPPPASTAAAGGAGGAAASAGGAAAALGTVAALGADSPQQHPQPQPTGDTAAAPAAQNRAQSGRPEVTPDDVHLDALARRLWEYIRTHMRGELLVDRERAGKLSDASR